MPNIHKRKSLVKMTPSRSALLVIGLLAGCHRLEPLEPVESASEPPVSTAPKPPAPKPPAPKPPAPKPTLIVPVPTGIAPAALLDLSHWILTLPVDADGGNSGHATIKTVDELLDGYSSPWIYGSSHDGVTFWAPVNGAVTPNSRYPRSELRQALDPSDVSVNWRASDTSQLKATVAVNQVPSNGKVIISKILAYREDGADISYLLYLVFDYNKASGRASLYGLLRDTPQNDGSAPRKLPLLANLQLNEVFSYSILVKGGKLNLSAGSQKVSTAIGPDWFALGLYFRAGVGLSTFGPSATEGGRASFFELEATHSGG